MVFGPLSSIALAIMLLAGQSATNLPASKPPRTLTAESGSVRVEAPNFGSWGEPLCDTNGNVFFHLDTGNYNTPEILEIAHDGRAGATFKLPHDINEKAVFDDFFVSQDGTVRLLVHEEGKDSERLLFTFDDDGDAGSPVKLETPDKVIIQNAVVFPDGGVILAGFYNDAASEENRGHRYIAIYGPTGKVIKRFPPKETGLVNPAKATGTALPDGAATVGDDGNAYFSAMNKLTVVSSTGQTLRTLDFERPGSEWSVERRSVSKGLIAISFQKVGARHTVEKRYLLMSSTSGDVLGLYQPGEETGNQDICFRDGSELVFLKFDSAQKMWFVSAKVP